VKYIYILLLVVMTSCKSNKDESATTTIVEQTNPIVVFQGQDRGCRDWYNPIFCADKYKPKNSLSAGVGGEDNVSIYIKDANGKIILLDKNQTDFLLNLKNKDK